MSTYMYLDSNFRSNISELPSNYVITVGQGNLWSNLPKDLNDGVTSWTKTIVEVVDVTLETYYIYPRPIIRLNVFDLTQLDSSTINSLNSLDSFRFLLKENYNNFGWRSYYSTMAIPMSFNSKSTYQINITDIENKNPLDITRSIITLKLTPIERFNDIKYKDIIFKNESINYYSHQKPHN